MKPQLMGSALVTVPVAPAKAAASCKVGPNYTTPSANVAKQWTSEAEVTNQSLTSGDKPGAAPTLVLGPYGAAARFVMAGKDLDKNVKQTAAQIADRLAKRVQQPGQTTR